MAVREIRKKGDELLGKKSKIVKNFDEKLHILLDDMYETMKKYEGVGLAAPQVGILKRVFIIDVGDDLVEAVNPEIIEESGEQTDREGCLSIPDEFYEVTRPYYVTVKAQDRNGNEFTVQGEGLKARALRHEYDHLDGILFIEKSDEYKEAFGERI